MRHHEGTFAGSDGLELYFQLWHPDDSPKGSLIIVHGLGEYGGRYMNLVNVLTSNGYVVSAFDNRGHGQSSGQRGHVHCFAEYRQDVSVFIRFLKTTKKLKRPLFLMGHSLGGLIVLDTVFHGITGIEGIVVSSPALDDGAISFFRRSAAKVLSRVWPTLSLNTGMDVTGISRDPQVVAVYRADPLVHGKGTARLATEAARTMAWCHQHADSLQIPILMIHGTADRITSPKRSRDLFERFSRSNKKYIAFEGGYHESHNDLHYPKATAEILNWLNAQLTS